MAQQPKFSSPGQIIPIALHTEMEQSYLEYAMSVIVGRALPDVRDGLKPVHRRIIYAMHELGLSSDRPFRKCARVVGDVLGKYHPHGDQAVYDALVRMVQEFSSRYPMISGHGNFGSVDNDPPAAMRYTETRLAALGEQLMLGNISEAVVDFTSNFDNSQQEPVVLPAQLPMLLLNGCSGIAVGMATNIPPHNLGEIVEGLIALIDRPQLRDEELWQYIPGPDFPTGGEIIDTDGIREAYLTGRGLVPVRGVAQIETLDVGKRRKKEREVIVVTELPFQVNKSAWVEKVADLVNNGKLEGIADLRDESDRNGMRVVIELKKEVDGQEMFKKLCQQTVLQSNFGIILLSLVDNRPVQLSLKALLQEFLGFREATMRRQYQHELTEAENRLHLVDGLLRALNHLDHLIEILRHAPDGSSAKQQLQDQLQFSEAQGDSILAMPMRRLTGLERQKLQSESEDLHARIESLQKLLNHRHELLKVLKKELRSQKRKFGDERRTRILKPTFFPSDRLPKPPEPNPHPQRGPERAPQAQAAIAPTEPLLAILEPELSQPDSPEILPEPFSDILLEPPLSSLQPASASNQSASPVEASLPVSSLPVLAKKTDPLPHSVSIDPGSTKGTPSFKKTNQVIKTPPADTSIPAPALRLFTPQALPSDALVSLTPFGEIGWRSPSMPIPDDLFICVEYPRNNRDQLILVTDTGKLTPLALSEIPALPQTQPILGLLSGVIQRDCDRIVAQFFMPEASDEAWLLLSASGRIKRVLTEEITDLTPRGLSITKLKEDDRLQFWLPTQAQPELILATDGGRVLRFALNDATAPIMSRSAQGNGIVRLRSQEKLVGCLAVSKSDRLLLISQRGYGKKLPVNELRLGNIGDIGNQALRFAETSDALAGILRLGASSVLHAWTNRDRQLSVSQESIPLLNKDGQGKKIVNLGEGETIKQIYWA
jgi:DNA gyrase subunit A